MECDAVVDECGCGEGKEGCERVSIWRGEYEVKRGMRYVGAFLEVVVDIHRFHVKYNTQTRFA